MAKTIGPIKIKKYSLEFKLKAVHLSSQRGADQGRGGVALHPPFHALRVAQAGQGR